MCINQYIHYSYILHCIHCWQSYLSRVFDWLPVVLPNFYFPSISNPPMWTPLNHISSFEYASPRIGSGSRIFCFHDCTVRKKASLENSIDYRCFILQQSPNLLSQKRIIKHSQILKAHTTHWFRLCPPFPNNVDNTLYKYTLQVWSIRYNLSLESVCLSL